MATRTHKTPRKPLTDAEIEEMVAKYQANTHSLKDLAEEYGSNTTTVTRVLRARGVKFRPPGATEFQRQKQLERNRRVREQNRAFETYAENIAAAEPVPTTDGHLGLSPEEYVDRAAKVLEEPTHTTWSGGDEGDLVAFNEKLIQVEDLVKPLAAFTTHLPEGDLTWQTRDGAKPQETWVQMLPSEELDSSAIHLPGSAPRVQPLRDDDYGQGAAEVPDEDDLIITHEQEVAMLLRDAEAFKEEIHRLRSEQHAAEKLRWESGVAFGYDQATNHVIALVNHLLTDPKEFAVSNSWTKDALERVIHHLETGEHFYRARRNPKPWNDAQNWSER